MTPVFKVEEEDKSRIVALCSEMEVIVVDSSNIDEPHKKRLLKRISAIKLELHSPKGRFDVILAGISDVGETFGKFGEDVKPLVDRMKEIRSITRSETTEYDELPPPEENKRLLPPEDK